MTTENGKILVVDDSEDIRFLVCAMLRSMGYATLESENGSDALERLSLDSCIRLVITDYDMPVIDGLELTRRIRRDERLEDLPVLMQSASPLECLETRAATAGVTRLLGKPITLDTLRREVEQALHDDQTAHVWRALLVGLPQDSAGTIRSTLSDAGFQVLQVGDEAAARTLLQTIDRVDLAFVSHVHPEYGQFIRVHLLRSMKDFCLFRLVLLMSAALPPEKFTGRNVCVAGYLMNPVSPEKVNSLLGRLGLASIQARG
jgi:CheY-like chemotaxis protein